MRERTELEQALAANKDYAFVRGAGIYASEIQSVLDRIGPEICKAVGPDALVEHMRVVYEAANSEHATIPSALLTFMNYIHDGAYVLDLGCGHDRDAVFLALRDGELRKKFMWRVEDRETPSAYISVPTKSARVVGVDYAKSMELIADRLAQAHGLNTDPNDPPADTVFLSGIDAQSHQSALGEAV